MILMAFFLNLYHLLNITTCKSHFQKDNANTLRVNVIESLLEIAFAQSAMFCVWRFLSNY